jgi:hypothetical protein
MGFFLEATYIYLERVRQDNPLFHMALSVQKRGLACRTLCFDQYGHHQTFKIVV